MILMWGERWHSQQKREIERSAFLYNGILWEKKENKEKKKKMITVFSKTII